VVEKTQRRSHKLILNDPPKKEKVRQQSKDNKNQNPKKQPDTWNHIQHTETGPEDHSALPFPG